MIATQKDVLNFIPQRDPFIAIHSIVAVDDESAQTQFEILKDSIFVCDNHISEGGLLENMAQTAAAQMGYQCSLAGTPVPIGHIGSVKNLVVRQLPQVGQILDTKITITNRIMGAIIARATVRSADVMVCECEIRVFVKDVN